MATRQCPDRPASRLAELDALRGIAALMVVLFHYTFRSTHVLPGAVPIAHGLNWGHFGVQLFFAISGFVILMTLERTHATADFLVSRFARLYPAYWFAVILTTLGVTALGAGQLAQPPAIVAANLTMLHGFLYLPAVDGAYWSLTVELAFYACMATLWRARQLHRIESILLGWIALKFLWWLVPALPSRVGIALVQQYVPFFALGMCAYRVRQRVRTWAQQAPVLVLGFAAVALCDDLPHALVFAVLAGLFAALVAGKLKPLSHPVLLWLGAMSYPVYLIHENLGYALIARLESVGIAPAPALVAALIAAYATAHLLHQCIEQPALHSIRAWWRHRPATAAMPA
ncbi:MAG: acyltransferase [Sphingomonadales bacterium]|nr:acyltransferase [Sphingomonadales bacterium]